MSLGRTDDRGAASGFLWALRAMPQELWRAEGSPAVRTGELSLAEAHGGGALQRGSDRAAGRGGRRESRRGHHGEHIEGQQKRRKTREIRDKLGGEVSGSPQLCRSLSSGRQRASLSNGAGLTGVRASQSHRFQAEKQDAPFWQVNPCVCVWGVGGRSLISGGTATARAWRPLVPP